jgi:hypothetical protein
MLLACFNLLAGFSGFICACWLFLGSDHLGSALRKHADLVMASLDDAALVSQIENLVREGAKGFDLLATALLALAATSLLLIVAGLGLWRVGIRQE